MSYDWLTSEPSPKILVTAVKHIGVTEFVGKANNPIIIQWAQYTQLNAYYTNDDIPWCGLFIAYCCRINNLEVVRLPLWALSWSNWGTSVSTAMLGDVLVFKRNGGGHVGIYVGEDKDCYHVLGGNQGDKVCVVRINKNRLHAARRTRWRIAQPSNVRQVFLSQEGRVSTNEQ